MSKWPANPGAYADRERKKAEIEAELVTYHVWASGRDALVVRAVTNGLSKHRVHVLTGISRTTIDTILEKTLRM